MSSAVLLAALVRAAFPGPPALGQTTGAQNPPLVIGTLYGRDLFNFYCATCHGVDGTGGGPTAAALRVVPPDLTAIARRNGGSFPRSRVEALVTGEGRFTSAHGSKEMPVWGPIFRALDPSNAANAVRVANLVGYIESIQHQ